MIGVASVLRATGREGDHFTTSGDPGYAEPSLCHQRRTFLARHLTVGVDGRLGAVAHDGRGYVDVPGPVEHPLRGAAESVRRQPWQAEVLARPDEFLPDAVSSRRRR